MNSPSIKCIPLGRVHAQQGRLLLSVSLWRSGLVKTLLVALVSSLASGYASASSFVWSVSDQDSTLHLIGSMHLLPDRAYPLPEAMTEAYRAADRVVFETDLAALQAPATQLSLLAQAQNVGGPPLRQQLGEQYSDFVALVRRYDLPLVSFEAMQPWFASLNLELANYLRAGFKPSRGLDQHFHNLALADGKPRLGLETTEAHMALLTSMGDDGGLDLLRSTIAQLQAQPGVADDLYAAWRDGDVAAMTALAQPLRDDSPAAYAHLLTDRNKSWMPKLVELLAGSDDVAVVVGALHLVGDDSLIDLFAQRDLVAIQR